MSQSKVAKILKITRRREIRPPPGAMPGALTVDPNAARPVIDVMGYGPEALVELRDATMADLDGFIGKHRVVWINVTGLGDPAIIQAFGTRFGFHRLSLADVVHTYQRPKVENYDGYLYLVFRAPEPGPEHSVVTEQISLFLMKGIVITFQEGRADCFEGVRDRIRRSLGRIRAAEADYLAYSLLDAGTDGFFPVVERIGDEIESIEEGLTASWSTSTTHAIYQLRHQLMVVRRAVWPLRDLTNTLLRDECPVITQETRVYIRDCYDHCVQLMDLVDNHREISTSLMEMQLSLASYRMNEVMRVLTVIATLFMPLTFIVGIYGMNFDRDASALSMPELGWKYGYVGCLALCAVIAGAMLFYFRRRQWL
ncbi:MAG: magnesium/cobalt transporter CorA [Phycisphaerales bacterium]